MDNKKIIKYTKPTTDPLIIGAAGGVKVVKKAPAGSQSITGGLIIGAKGVIKAAPPPPVMEVVEGEEEPQPTPVASHAQEPPTHAATPVSGPPQHHQGGANFDPNEARTVRIEKMIEEKMARADQMLEDAETKQRLANQQLEESQIKAKEIVKEAQVKAKKLIEDAKQYCQQLQAGAEREGFEQGRELGLEAGKQEAGILMQQAMMVINRIMEERKKLYQDLEPQIADLSLEIAKKIINTEVTLNNDIVLNLIKSNLDKIKDREEIVVRVNQDDYAYVKEHEDELRRVLEGAKKFRIEADGIVEKGGCMLDTNLGNLDARIDFQLEILTLAFQQMKKVGT